MTILDAARRYVARGFAPNSGAPRPKAAGSRSLASAHDRRGELSAYFNDGVDIDVTNGISSGSLIDIDLDAPEAVVLGRIFLPPTSLMFGRPWKRRSYWEYIVRTDVPRTMQFKDADGSMLVELRSTGSQTVWPPSRHASGETIELDKDGGPSEIESKTLHQAVTRLATCAFLARHWPKTAGNRHDIANALAGFLLRGGLDEVEVVTLVETAARVAGDEEVEARVRTVCATGEKVVAGKPVTGGPTLADLLGDSVVRKLAE